MPMPNMEEAMTEEEFLDWLQNAAQAGMFNNFGRDADTESPSTKSGSGMKNTASSSGSGSGSKRKKKGKKQR